MCNRLCQQQGKMEISFPSASPHSKAGQKERKKTAWPNNRPREFQKPSTTFTDIYSLYVPNHERERRMSLFFLYFFPRWKPAQEFSPFVSALLSSLLLVLTLERGRWCCTCCQGCLSILNKGTCNIMLQSLLVISCPFIHVIQPLDLLTDIYISF